MEKHTLLIGKKKGANTPIHAPNRAIVLGVDEAGLGPNLGPFVLAVACFEAPIDWLNADWWLRLSPQIVRCAARRDARRQLAGQPFLVDDSKRLLSASDGFEQLQRTVHAALPKHVDDLSLSRLLEHFDPQAAINLRREHWFAQQPCQKIADDADAATWPQALNSADVVLLDVEAAVIFPSEFNARLDAGANKSELEATALAGLVKGILARLETSRAEATDSLAIHVDRLGGRMRYRTLVEDLAGERFPETRLESPTSSHYAFSRRDLPIEIDFTVGADARHFAVAFASMHAKYLRERCMMEFNDFWTKHVPGLRPTAGYPTDARRFLSEIEPAIQRLKIPIQSIWRRR